MELRVSFVPASPPLCNAPAPHAAVLDPATDLSVPMGRIEVGRGAAQSRLPLKWNEERLSDLQLFDWEPSARLVLSDRIVVY